MSRPTKAAVWAALLVSACRVERTPPEYIDHRDPSVVVRDAAIDELQARVLALGQALGRGDASEAFQALAPAPSAYLLAADRDSVLAGEAGIADELRGFAAGGGDVRVRDLEVDVAPRANVAWFRARLEGAAGDGGALRMTGLFLRGDEGEWRLVQAHLSNASAPPSPPAPNPDAAGAPPEGGS